MRKKSSYSPIYKKNFFFLINRMKNKYNQMKNTKHQISGLISATSRHENFNNTMQT